MLPREEDGGVDLCTNEAASEICSGCLSSGSHIFLKAEGAYQCHLWQKSICRSCLWDPSLEINAEGFQPVCLPCSVDSLSGVDEETKPTCEGFLEIKMSNFLQLQTMKTYCRHGIFTSPVMMQRALFSDYVRQGRRQQSTLRMDTGNTTNDWKNRRFADD
jgi:hypothetical protein